MKTAYNEVKQNQPLKDYWLKNGLRYVLTVGILGFVSALLISTVHHFTDPIISINEYNRLMETLTRLVPAADEFKIVAAENQEYYVALRNNEIVYIVLPTKSRGFYGNNVELLVLASPAGEVRDVLIMRHSETPGIGTKIEEPHFLAQFSGKDKGLLKDAVGSKVDIITGATISSQAVINGVGKALEFMALSIP